MAPENLFALFDLDGTLSPPRGKVPQQVKDLLSKLRTIATVCIVSGSDLPKLNDQFDQDAREFVDYVFPQNGVVAYKGTDAIGSLKFEEHIGSKLHQEIINDTLRYFSELTLPFKRGMFIEYREGMLNLSPPGRQCSQEERDEFHKMDTDKGIRKAFVDYMSQRYSKHGIKFSIGGQISVDCFPVGWDKTFCLKFVPDNSTIHFFGDRTEEGGNDYEIAKHERTIEHMVTGVESMMETVKRVFMI